MKTPTLFQTGLTLFRLIAVLFSSFAAIITTMLPMYLYYSYPISQLLLVLGLLLFGTLLIHGFLTHVLNDYTDTISGTDGKSPGILSGGSRVVQKGMMTTDLLRQIGIISMSAIAAFIFVFFFLGFIKIATLLAVGLWSAAAYSLPSIRLSYYPWIGEWGATFPAIFSVGFGGAWLLTDQPPLWAFQNALIISLFSIAWVMVHHIPDRFADEQASPPKVTCVVWMKQKFGDAYSRFPAVLYFFMGGVCSLWLFPERTTAAVGILALSIVSILIVLRLDIKDPIHVSNGEKMLLILTLVAAVWIGIFI
ncbi:prenyltransferase [Salimicrobium flavidum]|uniref:1,4-dihydroxy-2-naphthoate octaprenyltransferase n=1 Tax=Salimicrobium flavidum TaxID=570947 RepID=A0A1N7IZR8_9BACI|nr:prenyltransferase [Salimicrobium flavidum]SIS42632.1 1,4-dihydroxy-2-naphthoate octaprenyltransferase [Salimicrobium flavidum]